MKSTSKLGRDGRFWGLVMIAPTIIGLMILNIIPFFQTIYMSFSKTKAFGAYQFCGLENYLEMFRNAEFWKANWNSIYFCILTVPVGVFLALIVAVLLNAKIKGKTAFRAIFFLPMVVAPAAVAMVWKWIFNAEYGILNQALGANIRWLTNPKIVLVTCAIVAIWSSIGYDAVLLLNQDAWIDADALGRLAEASRRHPRYGILSPIHLTGSGDKIEHGFSVYSGVQSKDSQPEAPLVQVPFIDAAIWYMPVAALKRVGLFAPIYKHYGEDKDLANRMAYHHYRIGFLPRVYGSHAREERKVTHDAFIHSEFVYHLSQETNPNEKYKHIHRINHLALWKKELMAIITLQWWRLGRFVRIWRQLKDLQGEIEKTRSESCNVDINNYR